MKVSLNWLKDFVDIDVPINKLCEDLTQLGLEVGDLIEFNGSVKGIIISEIDSVEASPEDDNLFICDMLTGEGKLTCLSRAPGLKKGQIVPYALPGAILPNGMKVVSAEISGRTSQGMMLSEKELGLEAESETIMFLDNEDLKLGENFIDKFNLIDYVIDIELTANRPDCLSIIGVAREIAAYYKLPLKIKEPDLSPYLIDDAPEISLDVIEKELCPGYIGREIRNIKVAPSPLWIKRRLAALGLRPINNIVDVTNYIMLETGQPLHAFDSDLLNGKKVIVRLAKDKEKLKLLDGQELELSSEDLVIADNDASIALAGVMGGHGSQIELTSNHLFLECANFYPNIVRRTSKRYVISTDSSYRFERGTDPLFSLKASERASELIAKLSGGGILKKQVESINLPKTDKKIFVSKSDITRLLGTEIEDADIEESLRRLNFDVNPKDNGFEVKPPSNRMDVEIDVDLIEEVARYVGYDRFEPQLPANKLTSGRVSRRRAFERRIKEILSSCGLFETITISLINENLLSSALLNYVEPHNRYVKLLNPLNSEQTILRTTLLINNLLCVNHNVNRHKNEIAFYEISPVYFKTGEKYIEPVKLSGVLLAGSEKQNWLKDTTKFDFFYLKGILEKLLNEFGIINYTFDNDVIPLFKIGESARVLLNDKVLGYLGKISPKASKNLNVPDECFIFELDFDLFYMETDFELNLEELPKYPSINLDIALVVDENIKSGVLEEIIKEKGSHLVEDIILFDMYKGKPLPEGKKSLAYSITYRSNEKTLTFDEVNELHQEILKKLEEKTGAVFRS